MTIGNKPATAAVVPQKKKGASVASSGASFDKPLDIGEIKTEYAARLRASQQSLKKKVQNLKKAIHRHSVGNVDELIGEIDLALKTSKPAISAGHKVTMTGRQVMAQIADLGHTVHTHDEDLMSFTSMRSELEHLLPIVLDKEAFGWYMSELIKLKNELECVREEADQVERAQRKIDFDAQLRDKVAILKGYENISSLKGDIMKQVELTANVPKEVRELLFHPVWFSRRLEKEFHVVVDRVGRDGCSIAGCAKDVDACVSKLESFDVSGKRVLCLDGKSIGNIMGRALELEKDHSVVFYAAPGSVELMIFGSEIAVGSAIKKLALDAKHVSSNSTDPSFIPMVSDKLHCNSAVAKALQGLSNVEESCGVSITVHPDDARHSSLVVRGPNEGVSKAMGALNQIVKSMQLETLEGPSEDSVNALFALMAGAQRNGFSEVKLAIRIAELKKRASLLRVNDAGIEIDVAATADHNMDDIAAEIADILDKVLFETERIELEREQYRVWNDGLCKLVSSKISAAGELLCRRNDEGVFWLEVWGDETARREGKSFVAEVHAPLILDVAEEAVKAMLENKCQVLQSIQSEAVVSTHFDRNEMKLWIYGLGLNKRTAAKMFNDFLQSVRDLLLQSTIKSIPIASDEIGRLIGPKGRIMNGIKERSDLEEIRISEIDKKVFLTGSNANIDHAISLIEEELSAKKDATVVQIGLAEDAATVALLEGSGAGTTVVGGFLSGKTNDWVKGSVAPVPPSVEIASSDLFPTLGGGAATKTKSKHKW